MCDDDIHPGLASDPTLSRRAFGLMAGAVAALSAASAAAQSKVVERDVDVKTPAGLADAVFFHPPGKGSWPAVILWPDVMGMRQVFRDMGRRLAADGYAVLVVNPYYRMKRGAALDGPIDFSNPADRAKLTPLRNSLTMEMVDIDHVAHLAFLDAQPQVNTKAKAGVQGYCMSGPFAFRAAAKLPDRVGAGASFHGGGLTTDSPESPHKLIPQIKGRMLVAIADNDDKSQPESKTLLRDAFAAAGVPATVEVYPGAAHGWTVKGAAAYNEPAAERAWAELLSLYKTALV